MDGASGVDRPARAARALTGLCAFVLTAGILALSRTKAPFAILLADRFLPGAGWGQIALLALYAGLLAAHMSSQRDTSRTRLRIWLLFSAAFFAQFILGVAGLDRLLMTGRLHLPVPAVVIAGPIYRGERVFMPILFLATVVLVGPAWCSHLCYVGAWDGLAASARRRARPSGRSWVWLRVALFGVTPAVAILLRLLGAAPRTAALIGIGFGAAELAVIASVSTRKGLMINCTAVCPLGLAADLLGRISPFRLLIGTVCTDCGRCTAACRYDALRPGRIRLRRPGYTCSLCGDCLAACPEGAIGYRFPALNPAGARLTFLVLVTSLHAVFLGVARI